MGGKGVHFASESCDAPELQAADDGPARDTLVEGSDLEESTEAGEQVSDEEDLEHGGMGDGTGEVDEKENEGEEDPDGTAGDPASSALLAEPGLLKHILAGGYLDEKPIHDAAKKGDSETLRELLAQEEYLEDLDETDMFGYTALHFACENGHSNAASVLTEYGADLERKTKMHESRPLHYASFNGHTHVVKALIEAGAQIDSKTDDGRTPLFQAAFRGHPATVVALLSLGADPTLKDRDGSTACDVACDEETAKAFASPTKSRTSTEKAEQDPIHPISAEKEITALPYARGNPTRKIQESNESESARYKGDGENKASASVSELDRDDDEQSSLRKKQRLMQ